MRTRSAAAAPVSPQPARNQDTVLTVGQRAVSTVEPLDPADELRLDAVDQAAQCDEISAEHTVSELLNVLGGKLVDVGRELVDRGQCAGDLHVLILPEHLFATQVYGALNPLSHKVYRAPNVRHDVLVACTMTSRGESANSRLHIAAGCSAQWRNVHRGRDPDSGCAGRR
jgi:hypothetical protein